jgi:hypothetical protein
MNELRNPSTPCEPSDDPLKGYFFWQISGSMCEIDFIDPLEKLVQSIPDAARPAAMAFTGNLRGVFLAARLPFSLYLGFSEIERFDRYFSEASARACPINVDDGIRMVADPTYAQSEQYQAKLRDAYAKAAADARERWDRELGTKEGHERADRDAVEKLASTLTCEGICVAARTLLEQSLVLTWGALEALSSDLFITVLNAAPRLTTNLLKDEKSKKRFQTRDFLRIIEEHGFDLSSKMGEVLTTLGRMDDLETIKTVFEALLPEDRRVREALGNGELRILYQRRNLIVHRGGIIDRHFLERTGEQLQLGTKLIVTSGDLSKCLEMVRDVGLEITLGMANLLT